MDQNISGILSNWQNIESEIRVGLHDDFGKSKDIQDILDIIHDLQVTANTVSPLRKLFNEHAADMENPHKVSISLGELELLNIMYNLYTTRFGVDMSIMDFGYALINIKRFATKADVDNNTNTDSIINLDVMNYVISKHDQSESAHENLFRFRLPGIPLSSPPSDVFEPTIAINNVFQVDRNCPMNYHDINGRVRTIGNNLLPVDYSFGKPACPIFGPHTNLLLNSKTLTDVSYHGALRAAGSDLFIITPVDDTNFLLLQENVGTSRHGFSDPLYEEITGVHTYNIYCYPLDRSQFVISIMTGSEIAGAASYDCNTNETQISGGIDKLYASIQDLANGWYRCVITFDASAVNITRFDVDLLLAITDDNAFNTEYSGVVCNAMGFWQHQLTKTPLPVPPIFTEDQLVTVLGTKVRRDFTNLFNPIRGSFVIRYLSPMSELTGVPSSLVRIGRNEPTFKTAIRAGSNLINVKRNRISTYNVEDVLLSLIDSEPYNEDDPQFMKRVAFTYGIGYQGAGFTDFKPNIFETSIDNVVDQMTTFFTSIYDGSGGFVGVRILQIPQDIIDANATDETMTVGAAANTSAYRINMNVNVLELGYDSQTDIYLEGYLLNFRYYSVFSSFMNLEFLLDQYIPPSV